jgi:hypothetical protein
MWSKNSAGPTTDNAVDGSLKNEHLGGRLSQSNNKASRQIQAANRRAQATEHCILMRLLDAQRRALIAAGIELDAVESPWCRSCR